MAAVLTLALGIGLSAAVFTIANALLLRRLPVKDQDRIVLLWGETPDKKFTNFPLDLNDARTFVRESRTLEKGAFFGYEGASELTSTDGAQTNRVKSVVIGGDFFGVLGARPALGRPIVDSDQQFGSAKVAVLSHAGWQRQFGGDPSVIGKRISIHEWATTFTVVGVMPEGLDYPRGVDFWVSVFPGNTAEALKYRAFDVIGRLAPGATPAAAQAELTTYFSRSSSTFLKNVRGVVHSFPRIVVGDTRPALFAFAAAAALLLLLACVNVANLLLVRGLARAREVAVRSALGATRGQVIMHLLAENALLAVMGGLLGAVLCFAAVRLFVTLVPADFPRLSEIRVDAVALAAATVITVVATLIFALVPAIVASRANLRSALGAGARHSESRRSRLTTEALAAGQLAIALAVLSTAGIIARSLLALEKANLGLEPTRMLIAQLAFDPGRYPDAARQRQALDAVRTRLEALPGIVGVSTSVSAPFGQGWDGRPSVEGQTQAEAATNPMVAMDVVANDHFEALGMPVLQGRHFTDADGPSAPKVVMLSESAAKYYWPSESAIGKRMVGGANEEKLTVVGVVPDSRYRDLRQPRMAIYYPLAQSAFPFAPTNLIVRTTGSPTAVIPSVRRVLDEVSPGVVLANGASFAEYLDAPLAQPRLNAMLLAVFASAATVLAAIGLFGVMATMVRQRTRELGIRMAIGATSAEIGGMVVRRGLIIAAVGVVVGIAGALATNRLVASMLYEVSPTDALTLVGVTAVLVVVALAATLIPARSSTRIDPVIALRVEA
jgi:predicted permease